MARWIERQKNIIDFTLSSLIRRKGKNGALIFVYTVVVFMSASIIFFAHSLKKEASIILRDAPEMVVQRMIAGRHELMPISYKEKILDIRGVNDVRERLWGYYYDPVIGANYTLMVPQDQTLKKGTIVIGNGISRTRLANKEDMIEFKTYTGSIVDLQVESILSADSELITSDLILISEADFRMVFGFPENYFTDLAVSVRNQKELPTVALKVAGLMPDTRQILREEILRTYDAVFSWRGGMMLIILSGAILAFIIFAWDKASGLSLEEKREIGILKAIGWETSDVVLLKFWEGIAISLSSFLLGILFAYMHVFFTSSAIFAPFLKGWSVLYPQFTITPYIDVSQIAALFFLTVFPYTVATIIPSWRAATIDPEYVMRS